MKILPRQEDGDQQGEEIGQRHLELVAIAVVAVVDMMAAVGIVDVAVGIAAAVAVGVDAKS